MNFIESQKLVADFCLRNSEFRRHSYDDKAHIYYLEKHNNGSLVAFFCCAEEIPMLVAQFDREEWRAEYLGAEIRSADERGLAAWEVAHGDPWDDGLPF